MTLSDPTTEEGQDMSAQDAPSTCRGDAQERATLKALALAATPGPWQRSGVREKWRTAYSGQMMDGHVIGPADQKGWLILVPYDPRHHAEDYANAQYVAAASPDRILALVEENERLRAKVTQAAEWFEEYADHHQAKGALDKASRNLERANYLRRSSALGGDQQ